MKVWIKKVFSKSYRKRFQEEISYLIKLREQEKWDELILACEELQSHEYQNNGITDKKFIPFDIIFLHGLSLARVNRLSEALEKLKVVSLYNPNFPELQSVLGNVYLLLGATREALESYQKAIKNESGNAALWINYARGCIEANDYSFAKKAVFRALSIENKNTSALRMLAVITSLEGDVVKAENMLRDLLASSSFDPDLVQALSLLLQKEKRITEALAVVSEAEQLKDSDELNEQDRSKILARLFGIHAYILQKDNKREEARQYFLKSLHFDETSIETLFNYALLQVDFCENKDASETFQRVLQIYPGHIKAKWELALLKLRDCDFTNGWKDYSLRFKVLEGMQRNFPVSQWQGEKIGTGELAIVAEQGLGDEIMFGSCLPDLMECVESPLIECHPKLEALYRRSFPAAEILGREQVNNNKWLKSYPEVKYYLPVGELARLYRSNLNSFSNKKGYLHADPIKVNKWSQRLSKLGSGLNIGISWRGGISATRTDIRSIPLENWEALLTMSDCNFISLQYTNCKEEIYQVEKKLGITIHHWGEAIADYDETAALVKALDLIVSVQTALVHLSGALGAKTYGMISASPEWRYMNLGESMPWYPSVTLIRQKHLNLWEEVFQDVCRRIDNEVASKINGIRAT